MRNHYQSLVIKSILKKTPTLFCLSLAEYSVLTRPVNTQSLNYMSVSCQKILTETGYVNSAELGRPRKVNETLMSPYLKEDQSRSYFFCSLQTTPFPRTGLIATPIQPQDNIRLMGRDHMVPDRILLL